MFESVLFVFRVYLRYLVIVWDVFGEIGLCPRELFCISSVLEVFGDCLGCLWKVWVARELFCVPCVFVEFGDGWDV